ncbi:efflux RND transporter periplasmic adaptor subunit [Chitinophaga sp. 30R24]|uniref:efflux RND transporter periplasmic adaptor subunit n=1 Tax=Chitinophaga sp. 30R24 TaxID=3248838 RepID=UPI003B8EBAE2
MKQLTFSTIILIAALLAACSSGTPAATTTTAPSLPVATVTTATAEVYNEYPATIEGTAEVEIRPQVGGILEKIYVDEGAYVTAGQPLFKINDKVYREQFNNANAGLLAAQAAAANAQLEIDKLKPLVQNKVVSDLQLKTVESDYNMAQARVKQAEATLADAQINMGYTTIKAPSSGYIGRLNKKVGSLLAVTDAQELTTLSDIKEVHVYFSLSEKEFSLLKEQLPGNTIEEKFRKAKPVSLGLAGNTVYPETGRLDMVNGSFDKNSGAITIRASFPNDHGLLRSGNTGKIKLSFIQDNVMAIPQSATTAIQDKIFVFALGDSSKVRKQLVGIAGKSGNSYLVKDGLKNGDKIVLEGIEGLQDGTVIQAAAVAKPVAQASK